MDADLLRAEEDGGKTPEGEGAFDNGAPHQRVLSSHEHTPTDRAAAPVVGSGTNMEPD